MIEARQLALDLGLSDGAIAYRMKYYNVKKYYKPSEKGARPVLMIKESDAKKIALHKRDRPYKDWIKLSDLADEIGTDSWDVSSVGKKHGIKSKSVRRRGKHESAEVCVSPEDAEKIKKIYASKKTYTDGELINNDWLINHNRGLYTRLQTDYIVPER